MNRLGKFITGAAIGGLIGIGAILLFAPDKRDEWFDEIQEKTQDILVEFNRAAQEYKEEMKDNGSNPKTGDNIMLYVAIASMSIIGLVATTIVAKKKKMN